MPSHAEIQIATQQLKTQLSELLTLYGLHRFSYGMVKHLATTDLHPQGAITLQITPQANDYLTPMNELPTEVNGIPIEYHLVAAISKAIAE